MTESQRIVNEICDSLTRILNMSKRPAPLSPLARIKYPYRELPFHQVDHNVWSVRLAVWGHEYKHRGPRPKNLVVDAEQIREIISVMLPLFYSVTHIEVLPSLEKPQYVQIWITRRDKPNEKN